MLTCNISRAAGEKITLPCIVHNLGDNSQKCHDILIKTKNQTYVCLFVLTNIKMYFLYPEMKPEYALICFCQIFQYFDIKKWNQNMRLFVSGKYFSIFNIKKWNQKMY